MKKIILLAAVAITLAACNNEDNYIDEPVAAHISATIGGDAQSRASDVTWDPGDNIGISMSDRYLNIEYTTENGDGIFTGNTMFFRNKQEQVTITAYYPYTGSEGEAPGLIEASTGADRQTVTEQPKIDFLYAVKENVSGSEPDVKLSFSHKMSKLTFIFKSGNDGTDINKITSCEINGLVLDGTFNTATGECVAKTDTPSAALNLTMTLTNDKASASAIIFPQAVNKLSMKLHDTENQNYACELNLGTAGITAGNNYLFTITVMKTGLSVTADIIDWKTEVSESNAESAD